MGVNLRPLLQRVQGIAWGDQVQDSSLYFDGHTLFLDLIGRDAGAGALVVRGLNARNAPAEVFRVNKDGSVSWSGVPVSVVNYGAKGDGTTDDTPAVQAAIDALPPTGGVVYLPPGQYKITSTLVIGDGTSGASSTKRHVSLVGAGGGHTPAEVAFAETAASALLWFGAAGGTVLKLQGPIPGVHLEGFGIDCQPSGAPNAAGTGLLVEHAYNSSFRDLTVQNFSGVGVDLTAYGTHASAADGCNDNTWTNVNVGWPTGSSATCIRLGASDYGSSPHLDVARNLFLGCSFRCVNAGGNAGSAVHLRFTDACTFVGCETAGTAYIEVTVPTGTGGDVFPSSTTFLHCFLVGGAPVVNGTWVGTQPICLENVHTGDGWTIPSANVFRGYTNTGTFFDNKTGRVTVRAGTGLSGEVRFNLAGTDSVGLLCDAAGQLKVWDYNRALYLLNLVDGVSTLKARSGVNPEYKLNRNGTDSVGFISDNAGQLKVWDYNAAGAALTITAGATVPKTSASGGAGFRLTHGAAPSSPVDGDMWTTTAGLFVRINGVTKSVNLT